MFSTANAAALIRIAAYPSDLTLPAWPDLRSSQSGTWQNWLKTVWQLPGFAPAVTAGAPQLADQVARAVSGDHFAHDRLRRLVETIALYLLRWTTRPTPFGTFSGVAPVDFGTRAKVCFGQGHRAVVRPDGKFVAERVQRAEQDIALLREVEVVTNSLGYRRGGVWVLPCAQADNERGWDAEIRLTRPVEAALDMARSPVAFAVLAEKIAGPLPAKVTLAEQMLAGLVQQGVLLSALRPAMSTTDPAAHLAHFVAVPDFGEEATVDLRVDMSVTLPPAVLHEAESAASALVAVAPRFAGWADYHRAFIARWGPGATVPLREVLQVLGFPAGYRGSSRRTSNTFTDRDRLLVNLAQQSILGRTDEVILADELISRLHGNDNRPPIPHTELRFNLAAERPSDLEKGSFTLTVVSGSRHAGVAAGRFLHLLDTAELASFQRIYESLPTALNGAEHVQLSAPPLDARFASLARAPQMLPLLPVGDFHSDPKWTVEHLAVAGDGEWLWLVSRKCGRPVEPLLFNSVLLQGLQQPLVRFLTEIWTAWTAPCTRFDWGHASAMPFLPRVRRGRSVLHPARWIVNRSALPATASAWPQWLDAWQAWRDRHKLPQHVLVGEGDMRLGFDLDDSAQLMLLRRQIDRKRHVEITEAPGSSGWIDGRPVELMLTLLASAPDTRQARRPRPVTTVQHRPGRSSWLEARFYGALDDILSGIADWSDSCLPAGWWFIRFPDPELHLRLRVPVPTGGFGDVAAVIAAKAQQLEGDGIAHDFALHTYRPETRYGIRPQTVVAAEAVFAADSRAALRQLHGDRQAATTAGIIALADAFTGDGLCWLAEHIPHHSGPRLDPVQLNLARAVRHDERLDAAVRLYRTHVNGEGLDPNAVMGDLLHMHHARMIGVDTASERHCLRLARAIARTSREKR